MQESENQIQAQIVQYYTNNYCLKHHNPRGLIWSVPNELSGGNKIATMQSIATGLKAGVSDLIVILPSGELIFIECKTATGKQSDKQKDFQLRVEELGFKYFLVRSLEDFKKLL